MRKIETMLGPEMASQGRYWNRGLKLIEGCTTVDESCDNCWAAAMDQRCTKKVKPNMKLNNGQCSGIVFCRPDRIDIPLHIKKPTVFTIWNDLFHEDVPFDFIKSVYEIIRKCPQHVFMVVTKRAKRMREFLSLYDFWAFDLLANVWGIFSVCNQQTFDDRIEDIMLCLASKRIINIEPMLGSVNLQFKHGSLGRVTPEGVILGCESGPKRRPCEIRWMESVVNQCADAGVPCWVKRASINGKISHNMNEWPESIRVRRLPVERSE